MGDTGKRGRPARLNRDDIIATAAQLLLGDAGEAFSIHALARALDVTPMAIYRHVDGKDALLQAVAVELLERFQPRIPASPWADQLRAWARQTRSHFLAHPAFFSILGWQEHIAGAWLRQIAVLTRIIARSGLEDRELANAVRWTANTFMASIQFEIASRRSGSRFSAEDIALLGADDACLINSMMSELLQDNAASIFEDCVDRVIEALQARSRSVHGR